MRGHNKNGVCLRTNQLNLSWVSPVQKKHAVKVIEEYNSSIRKTFMLETRQAKGTGKFFGQKTCLLEKNEMIFHFAHLHKSCSNLSQVLTTLKKKSSEKKQQLITLIQHFLHFSKCVLH